MPVLPPPMDEILMKLHDAMAVRTMPHFEAYSENWIRVGDSYIQRQAALPENQEILKNHKGSYIFCEALTGAPTYLSPDKKSDVTGFYVKLQDGKLKMHHGVPQAPEKADYEIKMDYWVNNPVGGFVINGRDKEDTDHFNKVVMKSLQDAMKVTMNKESKVGGRTRRSSNKSLLRTGRATRACTTPSPGAPTGPPSRVRRWSTRQASQRKRRRSSEKKKKRGTIKKDMGERTGVF